MRQFLFTLLVCIVSITACSLDKSPDLAGTFPVIDADTIRIASYNVENLFDATLTGSEYPEFKPGTGNWSRELFQIKVDTLSRVIASLHADIIALCEIESREALDALTSACASLNANYPYSAFGDKPRPTVVSPALLSRFPIVYVRGIATVMLGNYPSRNILEAGIRIGQDTITIFVNHWPSQKYTESFRVRTARILRDQLIVLPKKREYLVVGDFNCNYDECEGLPGTKGDDTHGSTGINHILKTVSSAPGVPALFVSPAQMQSCADCLYDPWIEVAPVNRFSYIFKRHFNTIDHILLSANLFDSTGFSYVKASFSPQTINGLLLDKGVPKRWEVEYRKHKRIQTGKGYSDHLPVMLNICRGPFKLAKDQPSSGSSMAVPLENRSLPLECIAGNPGFIVSSEPSDSGVTIAIEGMAGKQNCTAARLTIRDAKVKQNSSLDLNLYGIGTFSLRIRWRNGKWVNFNAPDFKPAKTCKYTESNFISDVRLNCVLPSRPSNTDDLELEIRCAKEHQLNLHVAKIGFGN